MSYRTHGHTDRDLDIITKNNFIAGCSSSPQSRKVLSENKEPPVQKSPLQSISTEDLHQLTQPIKKTKEHSVQTTSPISSTSNSSPQLLQLMLTNDVHI